MGRTERLRQARGSSVSGETISTCISSTSWANEVVTETWKKGEKTALPFIATCSYAPPNPVGIPGGTYCWWGSLSRWTCPVPLCQLPGFRPHVAALLLEEKNVE